uniref:Uncharacterized protein n=1 Tax=viral metagenome TaxID=1070528 RepID=A0A6C0JVA0_9ZZZZ
MPISGNKLDRESYESAARVASQTRHEFNAKERGVYIRSMVTTTQDLLRQRRSVDEIKELLPEFARDYKHLFEMITDPAGYDASNLQVMLAMLDHMDSGNLTQHDASVIVGKRLYSKFGNSK